MRALPPGNGHQKFRRLMDWTFRRSDRNSGPGGHSPDSPPRPLINRAVACRAHSDRLGFLYLQPHNRAKPQRFQPVSRCAMRYHLLPDTSVAQTPRTLQNCLCDATYSIASHKKKPAALRSRAGLKWVRAAPHRRGIKPPSDSSRASSRWLRSVVCVPRTRRIRQRGHAAWACPR
jgi:hypothetical protein